MTLAALSVFGMASLWTMYRVSQVRFGDDTRRQRRAFDHACRAVMGWQLVLAAVMLVLGMGWQALAPVAACAMVGATRWTSRLG